MEITELRIGNWVRCTGDDIDTGKEFTDDHQVISLPNEFEADYNINADFPAEEYGIEGVPLSEEWPEKLGFTKKLINGGVIRQYLKPFTGGYSISLQYGFYKDNPGLCRVELYPDGSNTIIVLGDSHFKTIEPFNYVHRIQNLCFALAGKEPVIEETTTA